jgi:hypothetical protein
VEEWRFEEGAQMRIEEKKDYQCWRGENFGDRAMLEGGWSFRKAEPLGYCKL